MTDVPKWPLFVPKRPLFYTNWPWFISNDLHFSILSYGHFGKPKVTVSRESLWPKWPLPAWPSENFETLLDRWRRYIFSDEVPEGQIRSADRWISSESDEGGRRAEADGPILGGRTNISFQANEGGPWTGEGRRVSRTDLDGGRTWMRSKRTEADVWLKILSTFVLVVIF